MGCAAGVKPLIAFSIPANAPLAPNYDAGAMQLLRRDFSVSMINVEPAEPGGDLSDMRIKIPEWDFILGWGAFGSPTDAVMQHLFRAGHRSPRGLCIGGNAVPPPDNVGEIYDVLFYETEWYRPFIEHHRRIRRAFGINTNIYRPGPPPPAEMRFAAAFASLRIFFNIFDADILQHF